MMMRDLKQRTVSVRTSWNQTVFTMRFLSTFLAFFLLALPTSCVAAPPALTLVDQGKSDFSIVIPQQAPASLRAAATELQRDIQLVTGVQLAITTDDAAASTRIISLGATRQLKAAGIADRKIADEGFAIVTRGDGVYLWGPDTPDGKTTANGGTSNGTANGVYTFLEDYLDVRWLMPGDLGRDVPHRDSLVLPAVNRVEAPFFINRREPYIQNSRPAVQQWQARQKLGFSFRIEHGHNWTETVTPDLYEKHPDWFAMINGKRPVPTGLYKLETTNPAVVQFFAQRAIEQLKANPQSNTFSLSPSDGRGWSQSPESLALYDPAPPGSKFPLVTPLILDFYRGVAQIVAKQYPQGKLAGYIYADYLFPPAKGSAKLPDNLYPVVAPSINYGYTLYRPAVRQQFADLMQAWSKITPHLFYYDLPNTVTPHGGTILPAAPEILNAVFPVLVKNNVKGVYIYGTDSWSNAAMANFLLARMMWNPKLDARALQSEWLRRAYGAAAGATMEKFYSQLDDAFREYYQKNQDASYTLTDALLRDVYVPHYAAWEQLFLQAKAQSMTPPQQQRLQLLEDNLIVLQWILRGKKMLPADFSSQLQRDDATIAKLLATPNADYELSPGLVESGSKPPAVTVKLGEAMAAQPAATPVQTRGATRILLFAPRDGEVRITPLRAIMGDPFVSYALQDAQNNLLSSGVLSPPNVITFEAKAQVPYFLWVPRGITELSISGAAAAYQTNLEKDRFHLFGQATTLYFHVPENVAKWNLTLSSDTPGETAKVTITAPDGKQSAVLETTTQPSQEVALDGQTGFWKVEISKAATGILDDVYLTFDKSLPQWVSADPRQPLIVQPTK